MINNIDKILTRGEKLDDLENKTLEISTEASSFNNSSKKVKNIMLRKILYILCVIIGIILAIISIIAIILIIVFNKK